jgi:hypothetical protein
MTRDRGIVAAIMITGAFWFYHSAVGSIAVSGSVWNTSTGRPITGATVTLDCRVPLLHGSASVNTVSTIADEDGRFLFGIWHTWLCPIGHVSAAMNQYIPTNTVDIRYDRRFTRLMPNKVYLTPLADQDLQRRRYREAMSRKPIPEPVYQYELLYRDFLGARQKAQTLDEMRVVRESFCERLATAYFTLTEEQRGDLYLGQYEAQGINEWRTAEVCDANFGG